MAPVGSQTSDLQDVERLILDLSPTIPKAVRYAFYCHGCRANTDEVKDLCQDVFYLLARNDYRALRSFDNRCPIETWLYAVVRHTISRYLLKRRRLEEIVSLDDLSPDALFYQATQEMTLLAKEKGKLLREIIRNLPERKRRLMELALRGLKPREIAKEMGIKIDSIYSEKSVLFREIRELLKTYDSG